MFTSEIELDVRQLNTVLSDPYQDALDSGEFVPALEECRQILTSNFYDIFYSRQSSSGGSTWPPHAPSTIARYGPHPLLILSGKMLGSLVSTSEGHYEMMTNDSLEWGTTIDYARYNNYGTGRIPPREFIYLTDGTIDACFNVIADHALELGER